MKRVKLDDAAPNVKKFIRGLHIDADGVELELNGKVLCKVIPPIQFTEAEKAALLCERRALIRSAQERIKHVPSAVIKREIRRAVKTVGKRG